MRVEAMSKEELHDIAIREMYPITLAELMRTVANIELARKWEAYNE